MFRKFALDMVLMIGRARAGTQNFSSCAVRRKAQTDLLTTTPAFDEDEDDFDDWDI
jgi:hypothetical protein